MRSEAIAGIQPSIIRWARERLGLSEAEVAQKLHRSEDDIKSWEAGTTAPTYPQLEALAYGVLKRPIALFFLPSPPNEEEPEREFRTLPDSDLMRLSADTRLKIRLAQSYQVSLRELFQDRNPEPRCIWHDIALNRNLSTAEQADSIRKYLRVSLEEQAATRSEDRALKTWRRAFENAGVFVFKAALKQKEISGFCLRDAEFPVIVLNNSTTKTRQTFSLLHELCHLLLQVNGIAKVDPEYINRLPQESAETERFCNTVAAEILIPLDSFQDAIRSLPSDAEKASDDAFSRIARHYGISREAILRRLLDMGRVSSAFYSHKAAEWQNQHSSSSGGDYYVSQNAYLSSRFAQEVLRRHYAQDISLEQAADYLGIRASNFPGLEQEILQGAAA